MGREWGLDSHPRWCVYPLLVVLYLYAVMGLSSAAPFFSCSFGLLSLLKFSCGPESAYHLTSRDTFL